MVTNMPYWAERSGLPRALAVEYPFGHTLGRSNDPAGQRRLIEQALAVLENAQEPGTIVHSPEVWPYPVQESIKNWQPVQASPIIQYLAPRLRDMLRQQPRTGRA
jgi:hypothetical protein